MADEMIRANVKDLPCPEFENPAFNLAPKLSEATVAVVTTAGLSHKDDASWGPFDQSFRVFETGDKDVRLGHLSPNFDRSGIAADLNVAFPVGRLKEMEEEGLIGRVAPRHLSFMGAQDETMSTIQMDTGPAAAKLLKDDGVDVVLLTPV